ncbi:hypothetical protein [Brevibacillus laterosporus]|uniref:hypothetical protein n=1 Tax=Brevibacillus laterosporus TaxID=1465 RepID=UPI000B9A39C7|nr:hypothetical protein [Brevibacillus laterosporus]
MIYNGFYVDKNGRANKCTRCLNEQINDGEYCKISGVTIVNKCTRTDYNGYPECEEIAEGNARYCTKCGEKTTFFKEGLLKLGKLN